MPRSKAPGLRDLLGLVAGYALAGFLLRHWKADRSSDLAIQVGFWGAYLWYGLAMSGPIVLWICRLGDGGGMPPRTPLKLGRLIADVPVGAVPEPEHASIAAPSDQLSFNEYLWLIIGGFWATLTLFLRAPIGWDLSWTIVAAVPGLAWMGLGPWIVRSMVKGPPTRRWTHTVASAVVLGWPFAALMLLLASGMYGN
ncbi:hypothetical protein TA3x_003121 [Tundrisphaera sp. TA3]|uniref:hypothetical protein n=1 Tax=Tundrisphaera sp. TA3 TaxID=3435775 RepID=UPI003EBC3F9D